MNEVVKSCIFCEIAHKKTSTELLFENENVVVFFDKSPLSQGHALLVTKNHYENLLAIGQADWNSLFTALKYISNKLQVEYTPKGFNFISNIGEAAYQSVMHLHIHLIPKYEKERGFIWPDDQY